MQPTDLIYLVVMIIALGMIVYGALIPAIGFLMWAGIVLAIIFAAVWVVSMVRRHGTQC